MNYIFPFGQELKEVFQLERVQKDIFVLGVYASAVHAKWLNINNKVVIQALPVLNKGQAVSVTDTQVLARETKPPARYTDASILSAMEHAGRFVEDEDLADVIKSKGIGTPATRAAVIERLIKVGYIDRTKNHWYQLRRVFH